MNDQAAPLLDLLTSEVALRKTLSIVTLLKGEERLGKFVVQDGQIREGDRTIEPTVRELISHVARKTVDLGEETALLDVDTDAGQLTIAIEVIRPKPGLVIFGAGHVGHALATLAALTGYEVTLFDDREAFVSRERVHDPRIRLVADSFESGASVGISSNSAVVIVTRGHQHDEVCLRETIGSPARYIGMIGSKRRVIGVFRRLQNSGIDPSLLERVHAPIGLDIGARSPQEIAVAVLAEIIQTFNSHLKKNWARSDTKNNRKE